MKFFTTTHSSLEEVFGADKTYMIKAYQRPYSWQALGKTDQNNQVNRMWDDLWEFFSENGKDKEYFLGSMVVIQDPGQSRTFEVVDGQQRLTTLALLFAAMRCFLRERCLDPQLAKFRDRAVSTLEKLLYNYTGVSLVQTLKVKILRASGYDYNDVVGRAVECQPTSGVKDERYAEIAERYFKNRDYLHAKLSESFLTGGVFTIADAERFDSFFSFLNVRVAIVLITTASFETSFMIFETLNNRGLPLTNVDLLRNLLLAELTEAGAPDPPALWTALEQDALTEDFMGRWAGGELARAPAAVVGVQRPAQPLRQGSGLPGAPRRAQGDALLPDAPPRSIVLQPARRPARARVADPAIQRKIRFLKVAGNERYSINLLLAPLPAGGLRRRRERRGARLFVPTSAGCSTCCSPRAAGSRARESTRPSGSSGPGAWTRPRPPSRSTPRRRGGSSAT